MQTDETELELKYLLGQTIEAQAVTEFLRRQKLSFEQSGIELKNRYFDTPGLDLARNDIGLRIRSGENLHEQTVKTAGRVFSGLHQRPEYNVALDKKARLPDLHLFPPVVWPDGFEIAPVQQALTAIFSTDFYRTAWKIAVKDGTLIELVLDTGTIASKGRQEAIAEFELELLSGKSGQGMTALFDLTHALMGSFKMRPGVKSKAARGYALWLGASGSKQENFSRRLPLADPENFYPQLDLALRQLQLGIDACITSVTPQRLEAVSEPLLFLEDIFSLLPDIPDSMKMESVALLAQVTELYSALELRLARCAGGKKNREDVNRLLQEFYYHPAVNRLQLALLKVLLGRDSQ
ncbi:CYTH domain-containing protein [Thalassomonas viridans]|uniref:CYTH domain-containing protein n=1 Tax=Thalassomonas viridans TaxID=137584 RepID=A0AAE9Z1D9_9GAMM|nr:CYTH domain-containing protein [Thalassomonas viridans]WDE04234.1 CYTH domain-containing protein [Thalassomonas viridans]